MFKLVLKNSACAVLAIGMGLVAAGPAQAGVNPFIGEIIPVGYNFCPRGWLSADGQLLPIAQNTALFSLYGTQYGGDGRTTFALPNLQGRVSPNRGHGPGLSSYNNGQVGGSETTTMTVAQMPNHTHDAGIRTLSGGPNTTSPLGASFGVHDVDTYRSGGNPTGRYMNLNTITVEATGGGQSVNNMHPYAVVKYCVASVGLYPSRS